VSRGRRVLVAYWPDWPVLAAGCPPDRPAVVVAANRVVAVTAAARAEGVTAGLRRREAQGRCPGLAVVAADPGRDARAWEPVVAAVSQLTPAVEILGPGVLGLATRGPSRYFGGDEALAARVRSVTWEAAGRPEGQGGSGAGGPGAVGPGCAVGVADGRFAAGLAARVAASAPPGGSGSAPPGGSGSAPPGGSGSAPPGGSGSSLIVAVGGSREWLAPHPVRALGRAYGDLADLLVRLGVPTLGDLAALPGPAVLGRFGPEGAAARRLAMGLDDRAMPGRRPAPELSCTVEMDPPEQRVEAAAFVAKSLADELHARLDEAGLVATMVAIEIETEHGESLVRHWRHEGALRPAALAERARWQLDGWLSGSSGHAPTGGITLLRLTPEEVRPDTGRQLGFWGGMADRDARAARAMARVQGLLGPEAVVTAVLGGGRGFAEQVRLVPWGDAREEPDGNAPWPGRLGHPAPALVHRPRRRAEVCDREGRTVEVSGRGLLSAGPAAVAIEGGPPEEVSRWAGPWPVEERWWEGGGRRRARLQVVLAGGEAHLVCREAGQWWVEASYG
jgi:protein ImuB